MTEVRNPAYMKGFTTAQLEFYYGFPLWVVGAWGIATFGGVLGSLLILFRRRQAVFLFSLSLVGMVLTDTYTFILTGGMKAMGGMQALAFSAVILSIGSLLLAYSRSLGRRGVLR